MREKGQIQDAVKERNQSGLEGEGQRGANWAGGGCIPCPWDQRVVVGVGVQKSAGGGPQRHSQAVGSGSIKLHNPGGPGKCRFGSQQQLQLGEQIETPKGCSGVRGKESVRHCMCPHPHQRHKGRTETGPQSRAREASSRGMSASLLASGDRQDLRDPGALGKDAGP